MSTTAPRVVHSSNISEGWGRIFLDAYDTTPANRTPIVLSLAGFTGEIPDEDIAIRQSVDEALRRCNKNTVAVSGMTIFPYDLWQRRLRPASKEFHELCVKRLYPRLKARNSNNRHGTYFERLMNFSGVGKGEPKTVDQLGFVIDLLKRPDRWARESALQMSCIDPVKDHTGQPVRGFPCLQQVGVSHDSEDGIALNAFYPTQYIFDRAYGNYLGLCHLGAYIAHQSGLRFRRLNCFIGDPQLGVNKRDVAMLAKTVKQRISSPHGTQ